MYGPHVAILLMGASRNTRRVDFRGLTGSQRTPRVWGVTACVLKDFKNSHIKHPFTHSSLDGHHL